MKTKFRFRKPWKSTRLMISGKKNAPNLKWICSLIKTFHSCPMKAACLNFLAVLIQNLMWHLNMESLLFRTEDCSSFRIIQIRSIKKNNTIWIDKTICSEGLTSGSLKIRVRNLDKDLAAAAPKVTNILS